MFTIKEIFGIFILAYLKANRLLRKTCISSIFFQLRVTSHAGNVYLNLVIVYKEHVELKINFELQLCRKVAMQPKAFDSAPEPFGSE